MEAAPFTFAPGAAPPLDLSLDDIIKQRKKDDTKKQKPGAKATPGKKGKPQAAVRAAARASRSPRLRSPRAAALRARLSFATPRRLHAALRRCARR